MNATSIWLVPWLEAHTTFKGMDEFQNGLVHPFMTPAHLLVLVAFGLLMSRPKPYEPASALGVFALSAAAGLGAVLLFPAASIPLLPLLLTAVAAAASVAAGFVPPSALRLGGIALAGILLGLDSAPDLGAPRGVAIKTASGSLVGLLVILVCVASYSAMLPEKKWASYGVRILASWIIAIAVMVLALSLRRA